MSERKKKKRKSRNTINPKWEAAATYRQKNSGWLRYSSSIAIRILAAIEDIENLSQLKLSGMIGVKPQQIHKIVKGHQNLTLKTIYTLSNALSVELITFPEFKYSKKVEKKTQIVPEAKEITIENKSDAKLVYMYDAQPKSEDIKISIA